MEPGAAERKPPLSFRDHPAKAALDATEALFKEAFALVDSETDQFFATIKWPEGPKSPV
jgi:hypothetical protein